MLSTMMDVPLTVAGLMRYGTTVYGDSEVVTCTTDGVRRQSYAQTGARAAQLAGALREARRGRGPAGRHPDVEQLRAPGGLPGRPLHGRGAAHAEPAARPEAAQLHRQPCRRPCDHHRAHPGAAAGRDPAQPGNGPAHRAGRAGLGRGCRGRRGAGRVTATRCTTTRTCSPPSRTRSAGPTWTSGPRRPCATPAAPPACPRAWCTATGPRTCTRWAPAWATPSR